MRLIDVIRVALCISWAAACAGIGPAPDTGIDGDDVEVELQNFGPAPELADTVWLNTDAALRLAGLRGKVTLIDFWTFG